MGLGIEIKLDKTVVYGIPLTEHNEFPPVGGSIGNKKWLAEHLIMLARKIADNPGEIRKIYLTNNTWGYPPYLEIEMTELAESDK
jgi:hypothetical protein